MELVFQRAAGGGEDRVDAGPDVAVRDLAVCREVCLSFTGPGSMKVRDSLSCAVTPHDHGLRTGAAEAQLERHATVIALEREYGSVSREEEGIPGTLCHVSDVAVGLSAVRDE